MLARSILGSVVLQQFHETLIGGFFTTFPRILYCLLRLRLLRVVASTVS